MHKRLLISMSFLAMMLFAGVTAAAELVNINKANAAAIQQNLVGIGPIKAEAIVAYRKKNGKFKSMDDLLNVTGLGPAIVKKNKRYLSMSKGVSTGDDKAYAAAKKQAKSKASGTKKPAKKQVAAKPAKNSDKGKAKTTTSKTKAKAKAKPAKSAKNDCSSSNKSLSKAQKKACAAKTAKKKPAKKKATKKKPVKKKPAKKSKTSKSTT